MPSATAAEVQRLIVTAQEWAKRLDKKVVLWVSDKPDAFVALDRRQLMRRARSKRQRPILLAELERRHGELSTF